MLALSKKVPGAGAVDNCVWERDVCCSEVSLGRAVTLCLLPTFLHPKAAFSLFIPLQGNYLIIIKMSEGIYKYIHTLNEELRQCAKRHGDLWAPGLAPWFSHGVAVVPCPERGRLCAGSSGDVAVVPLSLGQAPECLVPGYCSSLHALSKAPAQLQALLHPSVFGALSSITPCSWPKTGLRIPNCPGWSKALFCSPRVDAWKCPHQQWQVQVSTALGPKKLTSALAPRRPLALHGDVSQVIMS